MRLSARRLPTLRLLLTRTWRSSISYSSYSVSYTHLDVYKRQVSSFAQTNAVKGHVKDASGEPIMGATIRCV